MVDELVDKIDSEGNVIGTIMKHIAHKEGILHRTVHVWIYNSKGQILVQKRSRDKEIYPDRLDISAAGHIGAGESTRIGALREMEEEIGITANENDLIFIASKENRAEISKDIIDHELRYIYLYEWDGEIDELKLQAEEVEYIEWIDLKKFEDICLDEDLFVPHGKEYYELVINAIKERTK